MTGPDVVEECVAIRTAVRERFGTSAFANCLHTPTEPFEIEPNVHKFLTCIPNGTPFERHEDEGQTEGQWGRLAEEADEELAAVAREFWGRQETGGWASAWRAAPTGGPFECRLLPGDPNSIDFGMSVLYETFSDWSLAEVIAAYVEAEVAGSCRIYSGARDQAEALALRLRQYGMRVEASRVEDT